MSEFQDSPEFERLKNLKIASSQLRSASFEQRQMVLSSLHALVKKNKSQILAANLKDLETLSDEATTAFRDRLSLSAERIEQMLESLQKILDLSDPLSEIVEERLLPNQLKLKKIRAPLGVVMMIFEARPNVVTEAFSLAFKAGNAFILKGGKESLHTSSFIYSLIEDALSSAQLPKDIFWASPRVVENWPISWWSKISWLMFWCPEEAIASSIMSWKTQAYPSLKMIAGFVISMSIRRRIFRWPLIF